MEEHVYLRVEPDGVEPVHIERIGHRMRVLYTPGLVYGVAAGDEIEVGERGEFQVVSRGDNLAVRVLCADGVSSFAQELEEQVTSQLGGRLDGRVRNGLAFTVPVKAGFKRIEDVFCALEESHTGVLWEFGNVFDSEGKELGWWR